METDIAVIGGGMGGLAAAALAGRAGRSVILLERAVELGGRARSQTLGGGIFNLGPHALYRGGPALRVLDELGVPYSGGVPGANGNFAIRGGALHALPSGPLSLLSTDLLRLGEKLELARFLARIQAERAEHLDGVPVSTLAAKRFARAGSRALFEALVRVSTYCNAPEQLSAGAAVRQLQRALRNNVLYLDGGWERLVAGLRSAAKAAGARLMAGARVDGIEPRAQGGHLLHLGDGTQVGARAVIMAAGGPEAAAELLASASLKNRARQAVPVRAACLDLALGSLPLPARIFALGIDDPTYVSVHTRCATLGAPGVVVLHAARYLATGESGAAALGSIEGAMDLLQPGWRERVIEKRFLPELTVIHDLPQANRGGLTGRFPVAVPDCADAFVVGDWVGDEGMLADATLASAERAVQAMLARPSLGAAA